MKTCFLGILKASIGCINIFKKKLCININCFQIDDINSATSIMATFVSER